MVKLAHFQAVISLSAWQIVKPEVSDHLQIIKEKYTSISETFFFKDLQSVIKTDTGVSYTYIHAYIHAKTYKKAHSLHLHEYSSSLNFTTISRGLATIQGFNFIFYAKIPIRA